MKYWTDGNSIHTLYVDDEAVAYLYIYEHCHALTFHIGNTHWINEILEAKSLEKARYEAESIIVLILKEQIAAAEDKISAFRKIQDALTGGE